MAKQVIKFYANWCGPCKKYGPTFDRVTQDLQDIIECKVVNGENDEGRSIRFIKQKRKTCIES